MRITDKKYYDKYYKTIGKSIPDLLDRFNFASENEDFLFLTKASAVYSSNIEGNTVDLNTYMNYELSKSKFKPTKEIEEIENLIKAYQFAQKEKLTEKNALEAHKILSETLLIESKRGKYREEPVGVFDRGGLVYLAVEPEFVRGEMQTFFADISELLKSKLEIPEVFYHASLIHLKFAHIHPFMDGNGRMARLVEKWFLSEKLGGKFWKLPSEECYKNIREKYYDALNLGVNFYELDYKKALEFLILLPNCLENIK